MRILLVHQYFLGQDQGGGSRFNQLVKFWRAYGIDTTVISGTVHYATGQADPRFSGRFVADEYTEDGIRVRRAYVSPAYNRSFLGRLWAYLSFAVSGTWAALTAGKPDLVLATSPPLFAGLPGLVAAKLFRCPFVFEVRDLWPESAIDTGVLTNPVLIRLSYRLEELLYRQADAVNALTPAFREALEHQKDVPPAKIWFIPNGADLDILEPGPKENWVQRQLGLEGKFVVSYIGAHGVANHLLQVLDAAELLQNDESVVFLLIGDGMQKAELKREAAKRGLSNVRFVDTQPKSVIGDYINASDVCLAVLKDVPTFRTVYPNKIFDYMSCARPTVVAIDGAARTLVERADAGIFVPPENRGKLVESLLWLRRNPEAAARMGLNGRRYVEQHFDRRRLAARYAKKMRFLLDGR